MNIMIRAAKVYKYYPLMCFNISLGKTPVRGKAPAARGKAARGGKAQKGDLDSFFSSTGRHEFTNFRVLRLQL